jgi:hypothetical protein
MSLYAQYCTSSASLLASYYILYGTPREMLTRNGNAQNNKNMMPECTIGSTSMCQDTSMNRKVGTKLCDMVEASPNEK